VAESTYICAGQDQGGPENHLPGVSDGAGVGGRQKGAGPLVCCTLRQTATCQLRGQAGPQKLTVPELEERLLAAGGPQTQGTKADYVKFHDDKVRRGRLLCQRPHPRTPPQLRTCSGLAWQLGSIARAQVACDGRGCLAPPKLVCITGHMLRALARACRARTPACTPKAAPQTWTRPASCRTCWTARRRTCAA